MKFSNTAGTKWDGMFVEMGLEATSPPGDFTNAATTDHTGYFTAYSMPVYFTPAADSYSFDLLNDEFEADDITDNNVYIS